MDAIRKQYERTELHNSHRAKRCSASRFCNSRSSQRAESERSNPTRGRNRHALYLGLLRGDFNLDWKSPRRSDVLDALSRSGANPHGINRATVNTQFGRWCRYKGLGGQFTTWMGPILDCLREFGGEAPSREVVPWIADRLKVPRETLEDMNEVSGQPKFYNQVHFARKYLVWEGLLDGSSPTGVWRLTANGAKSFLTPEDSRQIAKKWVAYWAKIRKEKGSVDGIESDEIVTAQPAGKEIAEEELEPVEAPPDPDDEEIGLLTVLQTLSPGGFERVCQRLLRAHGFERVVVTGGSHDEGIDGIGILKLNAFVSEKVLFQCKRYKRTVGSAAVRDFKGSMDGKAEKGIILTTGRFTAEAIAESERAGAKSVELVDGERLVAMFESKGLGVKPKMGFDVDLEFFEQFK